MQHDFQKAQAECLQAAILAKAIIKSTERTVIVVVFAQSTRHEFYWLFTAASPRSPRKAWKYLGRQGRDNQYFYKDLSSFAAHYARLHGGKVASARTIKGQSKALKAMLSGKIHESLQAPREAQLPATYSTRKVEERYRRQSQRAVWNWR